MSTSKKLKTFYFKQWKSKLAFYKYENGRTAILLEDPKNDDYIADATVNIPEFYLEDDEVIIKNEGGNVGMLKVLMDNKIVSAPKRYAQSGFYRNLPVCKLLIKLN